MVSDQSGNSSTFPGSGNSYARNWENFRLETDSRGVVGYLPQRSIVRVLDPSVARADLANRNLYVPVEVVSVPNEETARINRGNRQLRDVLASELAPVKVGDRGRIYADSLTPAGNYTYLVTKNSALGRIFEFESFRMASARALELVTTSINGVTNYRARKCCTRVSPTSSAQCTYSHLFRVFDKDMRLIDTLGLDVASCGFFDNVRPVDKSVARALLEVVEAAQELQRSYSPGRMEYIDSLGLVKFPFSYDTQEGPYNSFHYNSSPSEAASMQDAFMNVTAACAFTKVLQEWNRTHPSDRSQIQIGDMWHLQTWGVHRSHEQKSEHGGYPGTCVDIRPLAKTSERAGLSYTDTSRYDRTATQAFVDLLRRAGADTIIFNDRRIEGRTNEGSVRNHDDHLHICFNPTDSTVQGTCRDGL